MPLQGRGQHETLLVGIRTGHGELQRAHAQRPVDVALAEVNRKRGSHEHGVEILTLDQARVLQAGVGRIHRGEQARRPEYLQGIDDEIERGGGQEDPRARAEQPQQVLD